MRCIFCSSTKTQVVDSRLAESEMAVRRRRECPDCGERFTTYERYESSPVTVIKRDGSRQPFDRDKLFRGLQRAAIKRPIDTERLESLVEEIAAELRTNGSEVDAGQIGELALLKLRDLDSVAYVRFASVYRKFEDVEQFEKELERLERAESFRLPHEG